MVDIGTRKSAKSTRVDTSAEEGANDGIFIKTGDGSNGGTLSLKSGSGLTDSSFGGAVVIEAGN